jgi:hypothetical protein
MPRSETFRKEEILKYLSQPEIEYFRIYLGMKPNMDLHSRFFVGVDKDGHDILPAEGQGHVPPGTIPPGDDPDPNGSGDLRGRTALSFLLSAGRRMFPFPRHHNSLNSYAA